MGKQLTPLASSVSGVIGLEKCHVRKMGFRYYVDLHIVVEGTLTVRQGHNIAHDVEDVVLQQVPQIAEVLVHVEPEEELLAPSLKR
jgi:divalent metal cation (Fe/Co/Zn/Cd) transporter